MSSDLNKAVLDVVWLSERLSGIITLKDELTNLNDLQNRVKSLEQTELSTREAIAKALEEKKAVEAQTVEIRKQIDKAIYDADVEIGQLMSDAKAKASSMVKKGSEEYEVILKKLKEEKVVLEDEVKVVQNQVLEINKQYMLEEQKLSNIRKEIASIKDKI